VLLTEVDIARLAAALGLDERTFIDRHTRLASNRSHLSLCEKSDGSCEFLEGDRCVVHGARPQQCRDFPSGWRVEGCPALGTSNTEHRTSNTEHRTSNAQHRTTDSTPNIQYPTANIERESGEGSREPGGGLPTPISAEEGCDEEDHIQQPTGRISVNP
jgi:Fe-S-cluster containining protein